MNSLPPPDPRFTLYRDDLAALHLEGVVAAPRYVQGTQWEIVAPSAPLRQEPRNDARLLSEALLGETFTVLDEHEGWAWGQLSTDGYVGYLAAGALGASTPEKTHWVRALRTYIYPEPDLKTPPAGLVSLGTQVSIGATKDKYLEVPGQGYIFASHLAAIGDFASDFVAVAEEFIGTPYLWGGRTSLGLDCSALIQLSLAATGVACPRDSDMQEAALGFEVAKTCLAKDLPGDLRCGDLVYWRGHTGVMLDSARLLHANGLHMAVAIEPLAQAVARIEPQDGPITSIRRFADTPAA